MMIAIMNTKNTTCRMPLTLLGVQGALMIVVLLLLQAPVMLFAGDIPAGTNGRSVPTSGVAASSYQRDTHSAQAVTATDTDTAATDAAATDTATTPRNPTDKTTPGGFERGASSMRTTDDVPCSPEAEAKVGNSKAGDTNQLSPPPPPPPPPSAPSAGCTFFLVRHGQSKPNVAGTIVSGMEGGVDPANGLTKEGLEQARRAGRELKEVMLQAGCSPANTMVLTSPFSRARETAEAIRDCLDCELREERDLRERWFGDLDGRDDAPSYEKVWALDTLSARHGELGVEPANDVAARVASVMRRARTEISTRQRYYTGEEGQPFPPGPSAVVIVSHGDALQLLQCLLAGSGRPLEQHRSLPHLENCGIRVLRPPLGDDREAVQIQEGEEKEEGEGRGKGVNEAFRMATGARVLLERPPNGQGGVGEEGRI